LTDLDLEELRERLARLPGWTSELRDTRLSDAPYVTVVAGTETLDEGAAETLRDALSDLNEAHAVLWLGIGSERRLESCDLAALAAGAAAFEELD
jgi:hypothetical protein